MKVNLETYRTILHSITTNTTGIIDIIKSNGGLFTIDTTKDHVLSLVDLKLVNITSCDVLISKVEAIDMKLCEAILLVLDDNITTLHEVKSPLLWFTKLIDKCRKSKEA